MLAVDFRFNSAAMLWAYQCAALGWFVLVDWHSPTHTTVRIDTTLAYNH